MNNETFYIYGIDNGMASKSHNWIIIIDGMTRETVHAEKNFISTAKEIADRIQTLARYYPPKSVWIEAYGTGEALSQVLSKNGINVWSIKNPRSGSAKNKMIRELYETIHRGKIIISSGNEEMIMMDISEHQHYFPQEAKALELVWHGFNYHKSTGAIK